MSGSFFKIVGAPQGPEGGSNPQFLFHACISTSCGFLRENSSRRLENIGLKSPQKIRSRDVALFVVCYKDSPDGRDTNFLDFLGFASETSAKVLRPQYDDSNDIVTRAKINSIIMQPQVITATAGARMCPGK